MYKKRNRKKLILLKALLCVVGLVVLACIASTYRNYRIKEGKAPYVRIEEVRPILEAFISVQKNKTELGTALTEANISETDFDFLYQAEQEYLTYGNVLKIMDFFPLNNLSVLDDYRKADWYVGLDDWNQILYQMIESHGNGEVVLQKKILLGDSRYVTYEDGTALEESMVLTENGIYENEYWNLEEYLFSNVEAVCYRDKILTVIKQLENYGELKNVYMADLTEAEAHFFWNGYHLVYPGDAIDSLPDMITTDEVTRKVVDIGVRNGKITVLNEKTDYVHGKLLQISENSLEIEGYGIYPIDADMQIYKVYGELASKGRKDLRIGYSFTDFVLEDGKIAACLMIKEEDMDSIRVLLKNSDLAGRYHENFIAYCNQDCEVITYVDGIETEKRIVVQGERVSIEESDLSENNMRIKIVPSVLSAATTIESIRRSQGIPSYFGTLEITKGEGGLMIINEVLLEDYLCRVVPSEMPSSYPKEALMAQAICARTYAYGKMLRTGLPDLGAHVDDSAGFQVYNNIDEQASTTEAVKSTHKRIAVYEDEPIGAYYYSTSCGIGSDTDIWHGGEETPAYLKAREIGTEAANALADSSENDDTIALAEFLTEEDNFREWITGVDESHYESEEGWYRWTYEVKELDTAHMEEVLKSRYANNPNLILMENTDGNFESKEIEELGDILDIQIIKRVSGGTADELLITGSEATIKVISELNIRYALSDGETKVLRRTGDEPAASSLLPSAFIVIEQVKEDEAVTGYKIIGGGFGHGVGMSQNGAKNMAAAGMTCEEILTFFYPGTELKTLQYED